MSRSTENSNPWFTILRRCGLGLGALCLYLLLGLMMSVSCGEKEKETAAQSIVEEPITNRPLEVPSNGYVTSAACITCHKDEHRSWSVSWHRTMTQLATPETVAGRFDGKEIEYFGWKYRPEERDGKLWLHIEGTNSDRKFDHELVMTTGSHHMQKYWYPTGRGREIGLAPLVYVIEPGIWVPEHTAFLHPTEDAMPVREGGWNKGCNQCHATGSQPRLFGPGKIDTHVAEFGISCEACHGPGEQHVREMTAFEADETLSPSPDFAIVHPAGIAPKLSAQVCGQCHGAWTMKDPKGSDWSNTGHSYRPGDDLEDTRHYLHGTNDKDLVHLSHADGSFWPDGENRVAGREYNGLLRSPCYAHDLEDSKRMTCISCHDLHAATTKADKVWANDQLAKGMDGNKACYQCHDSYRENLTEHTHHPPNSSGSNCYNCHMPHTSYGLMKAVRSHTITSPSVAKSLETGRPNACNQCHLDQTLEWSSLHLNERYGQAIPEFNETQRSIAASILWMAQGDAAQRAILAWSLGRSEAQGISGTEWMPFFLAQLMFDDYDAIRFIAHRSLNSIEGFQSLEFDHMKPAQEHDRIMNEVMTRWFNTFGNRPPTESRLLHDETGNLRIDIYERLLQGRDNRPVIITE